VTPSATLFVDVLKASLYWLFEKPWLYPLPASVPWLKLGVTECNVFFKTRPISKTQVSTIVAQVKEDTMRRRQTISVATAWAEALSGTSIIQPYVERQTSKEGQVVPLRYPVLLGSEEGRNKAFKKLLGKGLGVSCSYPGTLQTYQDLKSELLPTECPNAEKVSKTILTLPTHKYVTASDIKAAAKILASID
jgi:dTDP-4-amino-4,6-dideoxygalactose transaminase